MVKILLKFILFICIFNQVVHSALDVKLFSFDDRTQRSETCTFSYYFLVSGFVGTQTDITAVNLADNSVVACTSLGVNLNSRNNISLAVLRCKVDVDFNPIEQDLSVRFNNSYNRVNLSFNLTNFDRVTCGWDKPPQFFTYPLERLDYQILVGKLRIENYNEFARFNIPQFAQISNYYESIDFSNHSANFALQFNIQSGIDSTNNISVDYLNDAENDRTISFSSYFNSNTSGVVTSADTYPIQNNILIGFSYPKVRQVIGEIQTLNFSDDGWVMYYNNYGYVGGNHYLVTRDKTNHNSATILDIIPLNINVQNTTYKVYAFNNSQLSTQSQYDAQYFVNVTSAIPTPSQIPITGTSQILQTRVVFANRVDQSRCYATLQLFNQPKILLSPSFGIIYDLQPGELSLLASFLLPLNSAAIISYSVQCLENGNVQQGGQFQLQSSGADSVDPELESINFLLLKDNSVLIQIHATDDLSGVFLFRFETNEDKGEGIYSASNYLVSGSSNDGTYEIIIDTKFYKYQYLSIYDSAGNFGYYVLNEFINNNNISLLTEFPCKIWYPTLVIKDTDVNFLEFSYPNVNLENNTNFENSLFIRYNGISMDDNVAIEFYLPFYTKPQKFVGSWSKDLQMFIISFQLPSNIVPQVLHYSLYVNYGFIPSIMFYDKFIDSKLEITGNKGSHMPPIIDSVEFTAIPGGIITANTNIKVTITIKDVYHGFKSGYVIIQGYDPFSYRIDLDPSKAISGDKYIGIYELFIPIKANECFAQTIYIGDAYLENESGFASSSFDEFSFIHPLYKFRNGDPNSLDIRCSITHTSSLPTLALYLPSATSVNVLSGNRKLSFNFTANCAANMSEIVLPIVTLTTVYLEQFNIQCTSNGRSAPNFYYFCSGILPYGFGLPDGMVVSINNLLTAKQLSTSFSAAAIQAYGGSSYIESKNSSQVPLINYVSPYDPVTQTLTVSGVGLNLFTLSVRVTPVNNTSNLRVKRAPPAITPIPDTSMYLISDLVLGGPNDSNQYNILIENENGESNPLIVTAPPTAPSIPLSDVTCSGEPLCGGSEQGSCQPGGYGCKCNYPWYGTDCTLKRVLISQPEINESHPGFLSQVQNNEKLKFQVQVQIVGLREMKFDGKTIVKEWKLNIKDWKYKDISTQTTNEHLYTFELTKGGIDTTINATIQWFSKTELVEFGTQQFTVYPSTYKYKILMTKYGFDSPLNTLQLLFSSRIQGEPDCSSRETGNANQDTASYQYTKVQVNDMSLYGRFIRYGIIDGKPTVIGNQDITNQANSGSQTATSSSQEQIMAINIPNYQVVALLDPDFSVLVDHSPDDNNDNEICENESKGLTKTQLIGIIVGAVGFFIISVVIISYFIYKKYRYSSSMLSLRNKLSR